MQTQSLSAPQSRNLTDLYGLACKSEFKSIFSKCALISAASLRFAEKHHTLVCWVFGVVAVLGFVCGVMANSTDALGWRIATSICALSGLPALLILVSDSEGGEA